MMFYPTIIICPPSSSVSVDENISTMPLDLEDYIVTLPFYGDDAITPSLPRVDGTESEVFDDENGKNGDDHTTPDGENDAERNCPRRPDFDIDPGFGRPIAGDIPTKESAQTCFSFYDSYEIKTERPHAQKLCSAEKFLFQNVADTKDNLSDSSDIPSVDERISSDDLAALALTHSSAIAARAFEYDGSYVVAVLTEPFYLKSERDRVRDEIECALRDKTGIERINVLFDAEIYRKIRGGLTEEQKQALFALAMEKL